MKKKIIKNFVVLCGVTVIFAGCGDSSPSYEEASTESSYSSSYAMDDYGSDDDYYYSDDVYESAGDEAAPESEAADENIESASSGRKLIKNVNMSVQTKEFDTLIDKVSGKIEALGGYAESMEINGFEYNASSTSVRSAYIVARIPAKNLDSFITTISENSNITSKNETTNDVTLEYSDVEAHRNSLRVEQERLNELLEEADSLDTIIELEERLTEVRYELESYESRLRNIDNKVDYSTVYLDVTEVKDYTPVVTPEKTFGERLAAGFIEGWAGATEFLGDFIVGLVTVLPSLIIFIIIMGVIVLIIVLIIRGIIKAVKKSETKSTAKRAAAAASNNKQAPVANQPVSAGKNPSNPPDGSGTQNAGK